MNVPYDMPKFLKNGENKQSLFNLIERAIDEAKEDMLDKTIYFSNKSHCMEISSSGSFIADEYFSDHEEADTKLVALVKSAAVTPGETVMVRSPSGDIDILALFLSHDFGEIRVLIDNGAGKSRKIIDITSSTLPNIQKQALIGLHAFSGNDYVSSFFKKGKIAFWKAMLKKTEFIEQFAELGSTAVLCDSALLNIEKFICFLYGDKRIVSVDELRYKIFVQKIEKDGKVVDLSVLPPCKTNLQYHTTRANYVAHMYRRSTELVLNLDNPCNHGWDGETNVIWSNSCYPDDLSKLLVNVEDMDVSETDDDGDILDDDFEENDD